jgi:hypothetical protein
MFEQPICQCQQLSANVQKRAAELQQEWKNLLENYLERLSRSMPRRIRPCLAKRGGFARY